MKKTTLAVPDGSRWAVAFASEAASSGRSIATLAINGDGADRARSGGKPARAEADADGSPDDAPSESTAAIPWNPSSFVSARAALVEAETALGGGMDELVIFADPERDEAPLEARTPREIEEAALAWAAGYAELIREAQKRFGERGGGTVCLATIKAERGPLGSMAEGALAGLAEGMLARPAANQAGRFIAIRDESGQPESLARQVIKSLDEPGKDQGKLLRFGGRTGLFGRS